MKIKNQSGNTIIMGLFKNETREKVKMHYNYGLKYHQKDSRISSQ